MSVEDPWADEYDQYDYDEYSATPAVQTEQQPAKAEEPALPESVRANMRNLFDEHTIDVSFTHAWKWDGLNDPEPFQCTDEVFRQACKDLHITDKSTFFIHSLIVESTYSTAPYPMVLTVEGLDPVGNNHEISGRVFMQGNKPFTTVIPPDFKERALVVYANKFPAPEDLVHYGAIDIDAELAKKKVFGEETCWMPRDSVLAVPITGPDAGSSTERGVVMVKCRNKDVKHRADVLREDLEKLNRIRVASHKGTIRRMDRSSKATNSKMHDLSDAPGISPGQAKTMERVKQFAYVMMTLRLVDPKFLASLREP
jgi:hypothetical protein